MSFNIPKEIRTSYLILLIVFALSLSLRIWILDKRWINPDEGAHLMDAVLTLDGKIPYIDFSSRQPLYVYVNAAVLKFFGVNYISGRLLPMTCSLLVGFMVFIMALMLFDRKVAILSAAIYWMLPFELINSVIVKTEPLVMLLTCFSFCFVISYAKSNRNVWLIFAGLFAAMGYYVRQSALIIPITVIGYLLIHHRGRFRDTALCLGFFFIGYASVLLLALIYYIRFMTFEEFIMGRLSPFGFLALAGKKLIATVGISANPARDVTARIPEISHDKYRLFHKYISQAVKLHSFLLLGLGLSLIAFCRKLFSYIKSEGKEYVAAYSLLYLWIYSLLFAYFYYYYAEAFYIDYAREFLPPLAIIFSAWLCSSSTVFKRDWTLGGLITGGLLLSAVIFVVEWYFKKSPGGGLMVCLFLALFTLFYYIEKFESTTRRFAFLSSLVVLSVFVILSYRAVLPPNLSGMAPKLAIIGVIFGTPLALFSKKTRPRLKEYVRFMSYFVVLGAFVFSLTFSAERLTLAYDSNWSPASLEKTSAYLQSHTSSTGSVMSGAMIWQLQAMRPPFLGISHPLGIEFHIPEIERERLEAAIKTKPPEAIVLDGITEETYFRQIPSLWDLLNSRYSLVYTAEPAKTPVRVFRQKNKL